MKDHEMGPDSPLPGDPPRVLVVSGSMRHPSRTTAAALRSAEAALKDHGIETTRVCVRDLDLPLFDPGADLSPDARRLKALVRESDGILVGSPEYHGAMTGAVKNLLDYVDFDDVAGKPVALVAAAGGPKAGVNTLNMLRLVFRNLHAPVVVEQAAVTARDFDADGHPAEPRIAARLRAVADELAGEVIMRRAFREAAAEAEADAHGAVTSAER